VIDKFHDAMHGRLMRFLEEMVGTFYLIETGEEPTVRTRGEWIFFQGDKDEREFHILVKIEDRHG